MNTDSQYYGEYDHLPSFEVLSPPLGAAASRDSELIYSNRNMGKSNGGDSVYENRTSPNTSSERATRLESSNTVADNESDLSEKCQKYLDMIKEDVGKDDGTTKPMNIVVIGPAGVGKSSLICSLGAAFSEKRWREYAYIGSHGLEGNPITVFTDTYPKCCNAEKYSDYLIPTIIDVAGVENENNELWKELLKIVFFGRLLKGEALYSAYKYGTEHGIKGLKEKFAEEAEDWRVDRIIFISSTTENVPENLIKCVLEAARPSGDDKNKRAIPLFGVMTKYDQVGKTVSQETFKDRQERFIQCLGLPKTRYLCFYNYCDDVDPETERSSRVLPKIDAPLLKFMTQVCDPAIRVMNPAHPYSPEKADKLANSNPNVRHRKPDQSQNRYKEINSVQPIETRRNKAGLVYYILIPALIALIYFLADYYIRHMHKK